MKVFPSSEYDQIIKFSLYWSVMSIVIGGISGLASSLIFTCFDGATMTRETYPWLIYFLPVVGLFVGYLLYRYGTPIEKGTHLLIDEIHQPRSAIPKRMTPLILLTSVLTQLFGGSAGREAPAVLLSGALTDQISHALKISEDNRKIILIASIGAGFSAIFGLPLAGAIYGLEITALGNLRYSAVFPCLLSAVISSKIPEFFHIVHPHLFYKISGYPDLDMRILLSLLFAGLVFGLSAKLFIKSIHYSSQFFRKWIPFLPLRAMVGGIAMIALTLLVGSQKYSGLGTSAIISTFYTPAHFYDAINKLIATSLTLGSGFKGGELTPLFFVGTTLGNVLAQILPLPMSLLAGLGLVGLFSGASKAPLTSIILAIELFGTQITIYAMIICLIAFLFSGNCGLYRVKNPTEQ